MNLYEPGDVVLLPFPYQNEDGVYVLKVRPGLILNFDDQLVYAVIQVTSKNRSYSNKGIWVKADSERGKIMGLTMDSFVNLDVIQNIPESEIIRPIGQIDSDGLDQIHLQLST